MLRSGDIARDALHWHEHYRGELGRRERAFIEAVSAYSKRAERRKRGALAGAFIGLVALVVVISLALLASRRSESELAAKAAELQPIATVPQRRSRSSCTENNASAVV